MSTSTSTLTRALVVGALLAATNLTSMTATAHANDESATIHDQRPPTQGQVGESWHQRAAVAGRSAVAGDTRRSPTEGQIGEPWHLRASTPTTPAAPDGQANWSVASLTLLAALVLAAGLAAKRASRRTGVRHAA